MTMYENYDVNEIAFEADKLIHLMRERVFHNEYYQEEFDTSSERYTEYVTILTKYLEERNVEYTSDSE